MAEHLDPYVEAEIRRTTGVAADEILAELRGELDNERRDD